MLKRQASWKGSAILQYCQNLHQASGAYFRSSWRQTVDLCEWAGINLLAWSYGLSVSDMLKLGPRSRSKGLKLKSPTSRGEPGAGVQRPRVLNVAVSAVAIAILMSSVTQSLNTSRWWRQTFNTCLSLTVVSQSEARINNEHGIN